ncbi:hypothetical protein KDL01_29555 [Actinospica durhamensis]|uniref:Uncharacterized protein n=1 Tax=Actinospica durhamensis TaxID=1508375 RepID=A0A941ITC5_9ACTN|nr:hypothetical protein [Actinospica durhamensis]MBR7837462.1 hypothetical protein [Actinospica durhamensis]
MRRELRIRGVVGRARRVGRSLLPPWLLSGALLVTVCSGLRIALAPARHYTWDDSYRYVMTIERILGHSGAQARALAIRWYCGDLGRTGSGGAAGVPACVAHWTAAGGLWPNTPQYNQIFIARPGYPLLAAPFVALFGLGGGLAVVAWLCAICAAWLCLLIARVAGLRPFAALAAMIAFCLVPSFFWMQQYLTEGPTMVCTLVVLLGVVWALRGKPRLGLAISGAGYLVGFVVRYSTFSVQAGLVMACVALLALCSRAHRNRRIYRIAGLHGAACVAMTVLPSFFGWPGFSNSLQDTYGDHFTKPMPPNVYHLWLSHIYTYVDHIGRMYLHEPFVLLPLLAGCVLLWIRYRTMAAVVSAAALTGVVTALAHPALGQLSRLYFQVFLLTVFGVAAVVDLVERRVRARPPRSAGSSAQAAEPTSMQHNQPLIASR